MFPRKTAVPKVILGTLLFNGDNALDENSWIVPSVPKIFTHILKDMRAACSATDSLMECLVVAFLS
jgi:hypothetical protein